MSFSFIGADAARERVGLFVSLTGGTNSGKTWSACRLARGIAGPNGRVAVLDTEGGRTKRVAEDSFGFKAVVMDPPFRPNRFAEAALAAEREEFDALLIDSFSMEWVGLGGVLDWQAQELQRMAGDDYRKQERMKMASWIKPKSAHKAMVYALLQRRIPIIFSIRGEETVKPGENPGEKPTRILKSVCNSQFPYEVTVSFRLEADRKGYIDLSDPKSWKMEGAHQEIFRHGDRLSEEHGAALAAWARGKAPTAAALKEQSTPPKGGAQQSSRGGRDRLFHDAREAAGHGVAALEAFKADLPAHNIRALDEIGTELDRLACNADAADYGFPGDTPTTGRAA
ncbi:DEAD/DEAH box helicase family protein [Methylobacterium fujisawaense]|uniref:hypothetical protein n=1 Tax=Methylobacterium fujisawaense TaxID=107400 RepID=UPI00313BE809